MSTEQTVIYTDMVSSSEFTNKLSEFSARYKIKLDIPSHKIFTNKSSKEIQKLLSEVQNGSAIFIDNMSVLGHSTFIILKTIKELRERSITLHILSQDLTFHLTNKPLFNALDAIYDLEVYRVQHRTAIARKTRETKGIKLGRKLGKTSTSKYAAHRKRIFHLHKQGVPNTRIVKDIGMGTAQSLGKYIKQVKKDKKTKEQKKGTYFATEDDLKGDLGFNNR